MVVQEAGQHFVDDFVAERGVLDRKGDFHAANKISWHPVRAGEKNFRVAGVFEIINPAVFQKSADDADDPNVFAQVSNPGAQATDTADDQVDFHAGTGSLVEFLDDFLIHERIKLHDHATSLAGGGMVSLPFDHSDEPFFQIEWSNQKLFQARVTGQSRERVEDNRDFLGDFRIGREEAEICVNARGPRMIIAGAEMDILPEPVGIPPNDQECLAVCL